MNLEIKMFGQLICTILGIGSILNWLRYGQAREISFLAEELSGMVWFGNVLLNVVAVAIVIIIFSGFLIFVDFIDTKNTFYYITLDEVVILKTFLWRRERRVSIRSVQECTYEDASDGLFHVYFEPRPRIMNPFSLNRSCFDYFHIYMMFNYIPDGAYVNSIFRKQQSKILHPINSI